MKNIDEFVEKLVNVDSVPSSGCYGLYPFQMYVETSTNKNRLEALDLGGDVKSCYNIVKQRLQENSKRIYLALDFPAFMDIGNDFVAIISIENGKFNLFAIPYNPQTGEQFETRQEGKFLIALETEIKKNIYYYKN